ncbi:MAG: hypothetical protein SGJ17_11500 [Hyphomicrobiales bacterium]|nr:hypothetical protein [Hyphomicrobiales bacterium]
MKRLFAFMALILFALILASNEGRAQGERTEGPFQADGQCPNFKPRYASCEVTFGNKGLSVLNSFYEMFFGEGVFEIGEFTVTTTGEKQYTIVAKSNRGSLTSQIIADGLVRLGQDLENEKLTLTH